MFLRNVGWLNQLHGFISQKIVLITTAVRTSDRGKGNFVAKRTSVWSEDEISLAVVREGETEIRCRYVARPTCLCVTFRGLYSSGVAKRFGLERAIFAYSLSGEPGNGAVRSLNYQSLMSAADTACKCTSGQVKPPTTLSMWMRHYRLESSVLLTSIFISSPACYKMMRRGRSLNSISHE
jgi:hypothetical protein